MADSKMNIPSRLTSRSTLAGVALSLVLATPLASAGWLLGGSDEEPLMPIPELDLERYLGTWNQLAAIPQFFNLQCAKDTMAVYEAIDAQSIDVTNTCTTWFGGKSQVEGFATVVGPDSNAQLRVEFPDANPFSGMGDQTQPNYVVTYIDEDYTWALVGSPDRSSGFVLARDKAFTEAQWAEVVEVVEASGYDSFRFLTSPTTGGYRAIVPLSFFRD